MELPEVGTTTPFDEFFYQTDKNTLIVPIPPDVALFDQPLVFEPDGFGGVRLRGSEFRKAVFERTPHGWKRTA